MKRYFPVVLLVISLFIALNIAFGASASETPNDPTDNPDANACYTGGSMAGKCKLDDELWKAGWYAIRFEYGLISRSQVPDQYKWLLSEPQAARIIAPTVAPTPTGKPL